MNTATYDARTWELTCSFGPENMTMVPGGFIVSGVKLQLARKRQHRHSNPSAMARLKRTRRKKRK